MSSDDRSEFRSALLRANAATESLFGKLKTDWIHGVDYATHEEARPHRFQNITLLDNRQRKHAALGYISPAAFEEKFHSQPSTQAA